MKRCVPVFACLLFSCASPHEQQIGSSLHEGDWRALMRDTPAVQMVEGLRFDCDPFTESFFVRVRNGIASGFMEADENYSFNASVDKSGNFRALIPTDSVYTYKDAQLERQSKIVLVLEGQLSGRNKSGRFTIGDQAIDSQGCATRVQFVAL